ncbi:MAG: hypothetical protein R3Y63_13525 [Eubacteriales bacterium]
MDKPPSEPFLKSLYYGRISPCGMTFPPREDFAQCMVDTQKAKTLLESHLDDVGRELFADFLHKKDQVYQSNDEKVFLKGFTVGAKMMLEVLQED